LVVGKSEIRRKAPESIGGRKAGKNIPSRNAGKDRARKQCPLRGLKAGERSKEPLFAYRLEEKKFSVGRPRGKICSSFQSRARICSLFLVKVILPKHGTPRPGNCQADELSWF